MRYLIVLLLLAGCASQEVLDPSGLNAKETARLLSDWNTCVDDKAFIGYRLKNDDGRIGTVTQIFGKSERCSNATHPFLARVMYEK